MRSRLKNLNTIAATVIMALMGGVNHLQRHTGNVTEKWEETLRYYQQNTVQHMQTSGFNAYYHNKQTKITSYQNKKKCLKPRRNGGQVSLGQIHDMSFILSFDNFFYFSFIEYRFHFSYHMFWIQFLLPNFSRNNPHILSYPNPHLFFLSLENKLFRSQINNTSVALIFSVVRISPSYCIVTTPEFPLF